MKMTDKDIKEFCNRYNIPRMEMDDFIIRNNDDILKRLISNLRGEINRILDELTSELEDARGD